jgi:hypothetical protein
VVGLERGEQHLGGVDAQAGEELGVGAGDAGRGLAQAVAVRVLADRDQDLPDGVLDALEVDVALDLDAAELAADQPGGDVVELAVDLAVNNFAVSNEPDAVVGVGLGAADLAQCAPSGVSPPLTIRTCSSPVTLTGWVMSDPLVPGSGSARRRRPLPL